MISKIPLFVRTLGVLPIRNATLPEEASLKKAATDCPRTVHFNTSFHGILNTKYHDLHRGVHRAQTMDRMVKFFIENEEAVCDNHIASAFKTIASFKMDLTDKFWEILFPYAKALVKECDRDSTQSMAKTLCSLSHMLIQDPEIWDTAQKKLIKDNLLRYVQLSTLPELLWAFAYNKKGKPETIEAIEKKIMDNIGFYLEQESKNMPKFFKEAYDYLEKPAPEKIQKIINEKYFEPVPLPEF